MIFDLFQVVGEANSREEDENRWMSAEIKRENGEDFTELALEMMK